MPAGRPKPAPLTFNGEMVCAIDGDGTALCNARSDVEPVNGFQWYDVPIALRCLACAAIMGDAQLPASVVRWAS